MGLHRHRLSSAILAAFLSLFVVGYAHATTCDTYTSGVTAPTGYGAAWNPQTQFREMLVSGDCQTNSTTLTVGSGAPNQYVYSTAYIFDGTNWSARALSGTPAAAGWLLGTGTDVEGSALATNTQYVGYVCQWIAGTWKCGCADAACTVPLWQQQKIGTTVTPPPGPIAYPLAVSGRGIVDQNGQHVLMLVHGGAQNMMEKLGTADMDTWMANAQSNGFNAVEFAITSVCCSTANAATPADSTPFTGMLNGSSPDYTTPRESYWAVLDQLVNMAKNHNIIAMLNTSFNGYSQVYRDNGAGRLNTFGQFLGNRYKDFQNIIWVHGDDYDGSYDTELQAIAAGIRVNDHNHLHIEWAQANQNTTGLWTNVVDAFTVYAYAYRIYDKTLQNYNGSNGRPIIPIEVIYEGECQWGPAICPNTKHLRMYLYDLSPITGAVGANFGDVNWNFPSNWRTVMTSIGNTQSKYFMTAFTGRQWWNLVPDQNRSVMTAGYGSYSTDYESDNDFAPTARTSDGSLIMAYLPTRRTITIDMTKSVNNSYAKWFNTQNGVTTADSGPLPNTGSRNFTPPDRGGDNDWVFILEATQ